MIPLVLVFLGGGLGAAARHGVNIAAARLIGLDFPWGTLIVNVVGSLTMGALVGWFAFHGSENWSQHTRLFLTTGILGGFTTFSAFSNETFNLFRSGSTLLAWVNVTAQLAGGLACVWLGRSLAFVVWR